MSVEIIIRYAPSFRKEHKKLPDEIKKKTLKAIRFFQENPLHPSLRLHKLSGPLDGLWSISLDRRYRIIFRSLPENAYYFISIGTHSIYEK